MRSNSEMMRYSSRSASQWHLNTRQLDWVLLAGCSCLLTLMCQPIANALSPSATISTKTLTTPTQLEGLSYIAAYHAKQMEQAPKLK